MKSFFPLFDKIVQNSNVETAELDKTSLTYNNCQEFLLHSACVAGGWDRTRDLELRRAPQRAEALGPWSDATMREPSRVEPSGDGWSRAGPGGGGRAEPAGPSDGIFKRRWREVLRPARCALQPDQRVQKKEVKDSRWIRRYVHSERQQRRIFYSFT